MAQTNVMVTYAPARRTPASAPKRASRLAPRWGVTLAGALLAGGAVFALGQYVRPDGSLRGSAMPSYPPLASTGPDPVPTATAPVRGAQPADTEASLLPYLALVRDAAPPEVAEKRTLSAPSPPDSARARRPLVPQAAAIPAQPDREHPASTATVAAAPQLAAVAGQRRDLEGFLGEHGLALATPAPSGEGNIPAAQSTAEQLAPPESSEMVSAAATSPAPESAATPGTGTVDILELTESAAIPPAAALVETSAQDAPEPLPAATEDMRLASIETTVDELPAAPPVRAAPTLALGTAGRAAPRLAVAPTPSFSGANAIATPAASYVQLFPMAVVNGEPLGAVTLRDLGVEGQAVHLGALVGLLKLRMPEAEFARLSSAAAAGRFVTLDQLRAAGIIVQFDARAGRLLIDAR